MYRQSPVKSPDIKLILLEYAQLYENEQKETKNGIVETTKAKGVLEVPFPPNEVLLGNISGAFMWLFLVLSVNLKTFRQKHFYTGKKFIPTPMLILVYGL